jgi:hypothetical protein
MNRPGRSLDRQLAPAPVLFIDGCQQARRNPVKRKCAGMMEKFPRRDKTPGRQARAEACELKQPQPIGAASSFDDFLSSCF